MVAFHFLSLHRCFRTTQILVFRTYANDLLRNSTTRLFLSPFEFHLKTREQEEDQSWEHVLSPNISATARSPPHLVNALLFLLRDGPWVRSWVTKWVSAEL